MFKWFGSKWQASAYHDAPMFDTVLEPFAGGAGYALRHSHLQVVLAEKNSMVRALWTWLIGVHEDEVLSIPVGMDEGADIREMGLSEGQALLVKHWQRTNNVGDCWTISPWGNKPGQWTETSRQRVADQVKHIRHWKVVEDGEELMGSGVRGTWFVDPIYQFNYDYRMKERHDYSKLAGLVKGLKGQVIVCEARCPKTDKAPDYLPFVDFRKTVTSRRSAGDHTHSSELIYRRSDV